MSRRTIIYIVCGVIALHLIAFAVLNAIDTRPKFKIVPRPPKPNFKHWEHVEVDAVTGEKTIHREIEVSTRLTPRETLSAKDAREAGTTPRVE